MSIDSEERNEAARLTISIGIVATSLTVAVAEKIIIPAGTKVPVSILILALGFAGLFSFFYILVRAYDLCYGERPSEFRKWSKEKLYIFAIKGCVAILFMCPSILLYVYLMENKESIDDRLWSLVAAASYLTAFLLLAGKNIYGIFTDLKSIWKARKNKRADGTSKVKG